MKNRRSLWMKKAGLLALSFISISFLAFLVISSMACFPAQRIKGDMTINVAEAKPTAKKEFPSMSKIPLRLHAASIAGFERMTNYTNYDDTKAFQDYFQKGTEYPVASIDYIPTTEPDYQTTESYYPGQPLTPPTPIQTILRGRNRAVLRVYDWKDESIEKFKLEGQALVYMVEASKYSTDKDLLKRYHRLSFHNTLVDLLRKLDAQRNDLSAIKNTYAGWKTKSVKKERRIQDFMESQTIQEKPSIYVAYPRGNEEIADNEVSLFGYIKSQNRTENLQVLVNRRPVAVDQFWRDLRGYPLKLSLPLSPGNNTIDINVLDQAGYLENYSVSVKRVELKETAASSSQAQANIAGLPSRMPNMEVKQQADNVTAENFMAVLGDWVNQTAYTDYNKGNTMYDQGRYERASYYYKKAVKTNAFGQAFFNLGLVHKISGKNQEAQIAFSNACKMGVRNGCNM